MMKKRILQIAVLSIAALSMLGFICDVKEVNIEIPVVGSIEAPLHFQSSGGSGGWTYDSKTVSTGDLLSRVQDEVGDTFVILRAELQSVNYTLTEKAALSYTPAMLAYVDNAAMSNPDRMLFDEPALNTTLNVPVVLTPLSLAVGHINGRLVLAQNNPIDMVFSGGITTATAPVDIRITATMKIQFIVSVPADVPDISSPI